METEAGIRMRLLCGLEPPGATGSCRRARIPPLSLQRKCDAADALILDLWPPELSVVLSHQIWANSLRYTQETHIKDELDFLTGRC